MQVESGGDDSPESEGARQCASTFRGGGPGHREPQAQGREVNPEPWGKWSIIEPERHPSLRAWQDPPLKIYALIGNTEFS